LEEQAIYPAWVAREIRIKLTRFDSDLKSMDRLIAIERSALASSVALSPLMDQIEEISLTLDAEPVDLSEFKILQQHAHTQSLELGVLEFLKKAAELGVKDRKFRFINPSGLMEFNFGA